MCVGARARLNSARASQLMYRKEVDLAAQAFERCCRMPSAPPDEPAAGRRVSVASSVLHELGGGEDPDDETLDDMRAKAKQARVA